MREGCVGKGEGAGGSNTDASSKAHLGCDVTLEDTDGITQLRDDRQVQIREER